MIGSLSTVRADGILVCWQGDAASCGHTAWLGYESEHYGMVKAGIVQVPFGPGSYGVSTSWFFAQHFYIRLSDDMDLGIRWTKSYGDLIPMGAYDFACLVASLPRHGHVRHSLRQ